MPELANRMQRIKGSAIDAVAQKVRELKEQGQEVINFSIGVPNFLPPERVYEAAREDIDHDQGTYLPGRGTKELVQAFQLRMKEDGFEYREEEIVSGLGGKHVLFNLMIALLNTGDEVLIPTPYWTTYADQVKLLGGEPVFLASPAARNYKITPEQLEDAIGPKTRILLFNNPSNPTGMVYGEDEVQALGNLLEKYDIWIISDDIYYRILFDGQSFHHLLKTNPSLRERTVIVHSISKSYGMPGWRVGMAAGPEAVVKALINLNTTSCTHVPAVAMAAAAAAFAGPQDFVDEQCREFEQKRERVMASMERIEAADCPRPGGGFYVFPDISRVFGRTYKNQTIRDGTHLAQLLLDDKRVALVPGEAFGDPNGVRISYALPSETLEEGLSRLEEFFGDTK